MKGSTCKILKNAAKWRSLTRLRHVARTAEKSVIVGQAVSDVQDVRILL